MFKSCCCVESQEQANITFHSTTDESSAVTRPGEVSSSTQGKLAPEAAAGPTDVPGSARSLTEEEKEAEKVRLQALVNSFAKKATHKKGCPCVYLKEGTGERVKTHYRIDKSLENLMVLNSQDPNLPEVTCPIATIQDIYSLVEDGAACFPGEVIKALKPEDMELLLMVVFRNSQDKMFRFCLLEESRESRDVFLECLRILCIYAQSAPASSG